MVEIGFCLSVGSGITIDQRHEFAEEVERLGYESFWLPHFLARDVHGFDTLDSFCALAAKTQRILFGTGVFQLPLSRPVDLARRIVTIDHISKGRFILGAGVGWIPSEFEMMGVSYKERAGRADEMLECLKKLWTEDGEVSYQGKYFQLKDYYFEPKPVKKPHTPILWGGGYWKAEKQWHPDVKQPSGFIDPVIRRIARFCDGWLPDLDSVGEAELVEGMERIKAASKEFGRTITDDKWDITLNSYGSININNDSKKALEEAQRFYASRIRKGYYQVQGAPPFDLLKERGTFGPPEAVAELVSTWLSWKKKVPALRRVFIMFASLNPIEQLRRFHVQVAPLLKR